MLLNDFLPHSDFHEIHTIEIERPPAQVFQAIRQVTVTELPLGRMLMGIRMLPARLRGAECHDFSGDRPLLEWMNQLGVVLATSTNEEMVFGIIGQFWRLLGARMPKISGPAEFLAFQEAGFAKAATNFHLSPAKVAGRTCLRTETRIVGLDPASRTAFGWYWRVIYPGSALIRREWLRAIKRRAESALGQK